MHLNGVATVLTVFSCVRSSVALSCQDISIPVDLNAKNKLLPTSLAGVSITAEYLKTIPNLPDVAVSGNYSIGATFCEPSSRHRSRRNTLQILQHGAGYNRTYWSSLGLNERQYSWVAYAADQGFPTLAIDRLCNGASSHPNSIAVCQQPAEAELLRQIVEIARRGDLPLGGCSRPFNKVILGCHSIGSDICTIYANSQGSAADALLLTGWSNKALDGSSTTLFGGVEPAFIAYPDRYGYLASDPFYLTFSNETGHRYLSYYGSFDPALAHYDYLTQGTFTFGEALTIAFSQGQNPGYKGLVFSLNGNEDATYCQPSAMTAAQMLPGNCSAGFADGIRSAFPNARRFGYHITPNTGHCVNLHYTAQESYKAVHDFLTHNGL